MTPRNRKRFRLSAEDEAAIAILAAFVGLALGVYITSFFI